MDALTETREADTVMNDESMDQPPEPRASEPLDITPHGPDLPLWAREAEPGAVATDAVASPPARQNPFRRKGLQRAAGLAAVIALTAFGTGIAVHELDGNSSASAPAVGTTIASVKGTSAVGAALAKISPSVVLINDVITTRNGNDGFGGGFGQFNGSSQSRAAGTGIVISSDGYVVTNAHVVNGATSITVTTADGKKHDASIVGLDATADLAVIKLSGVSGLTPATFASSAKAAVGDSVIAVGNAEGYGGSPTVTEGIISAKDRTLSDSNENLSGLLQTDAAINPGNSGGPLVDTNGNVVGINTAVATGTSSEPAQNIGFAIPSDTVTAAIPALKAGKNSSGTQNSSGAFLGVSVRDAQDGGAAVEAVESGSPAANAGIRAGDVITKVGSTTIEDSRALVIAIGKASPGDKVTVTFDRNGATRTVSVTLGSRNSTSS